MAHIHTKKGLDIPIEGAPEGALREFSPPGEAAPFRNVKEISLNLDPFAHTRFKLLKHVGENVKIGEPIAHDKAFPERMFVSPAGGVVKEIRRGLKRRLVDIVIDVHHPEEEHISSVPDLAHINRADLVAHLQKGGLFTHIRQRPFNHLADPTKIPRSIFVKAIESAPFAPPAELQVQGYEEALKKGLDALSRLTEGLVHLVYREGTSSTCFLEAKNVDHHMAEGPHPISNHSVHIHFIDPIRSPEDVVWTLQLHDVLAIGYFLLTGRYLTERTIGIGGPGIVPGQTGFFRIRQGYPMALLAEGRVGKGWMRLISGDVLMGKKVDTDDFLGFYHNVFSVVPENTNREMLHFLRLGGSKFSISGAYLSGHIHRAARRYFFSTNQHGEPRAFIDSTLYKKVMPIGIPTMFLVKAVMAEDFDLAENLGLLEVDSEDFALSTFVCPSKIEMTEIIRQGLVRYAAEVLE